MWWGPAFRGYSLVSSGCSCVYGAAVLSAADGVGWLGQAVQMSVVMPEMCTPSPRTT